MPMQANAHRSISYTESSEKFDYGMQAANTLYLCFLTKRVNPMKILSFYQDFTSFFKVTSQI